SAQHHPAKPRPVLIVAINHERGRRVVHQVAQPLQWPRAHTLRLLVDCDVERTIGHREAYRDHVRIARGIRRGQPTNPLRRNECRLRRRRRHNRLAAMFTVNARMIVLNMKLMSPWAIAIRRNLRAVICTSDTWNIIPSTSEKYRKSR